MASRFQTGTPTKTGGVSLSPRMLDQLNSGLLGRFTPSGTNFNQLALNQAGPPVDIGIGFQQPQLPGTQLPTPVAPPPGFIPPQRPDFFMNKGINPNPFGVDGGSFGRFGGMFGSRFSPFGRFNRGFGGLLR